VEERRARGPRTPRSQLGELSRRDVQRAALRAENIEFDRFIDLPNKVAPTQLELAVKECTAVASRLPTSELLLSWLASCHPRRLSRFRSRIGDYITSCGYEWASRSTDTCSARSAGSAAVPCYNAAGRPVVVQDTGFSDVPSWVRDRRARMCSDEAVDASRK
jgi:hypothetical protein